MNETIDVIFPNYNKKAYISECLSSLLEQTYTNWRCIVVDSFSDDGSWEIIKDLSQHDARFELYQIPKSKKSFYEAWNFGLYKVTNSYFCILTSDDIWQLSWLETAIQSLSENKNAICAAAKTKLIDVDSRWGDTAPANLLGERFFQTSESAPQTRNGLASSVASYFIGPIYTSIHSLLMRSEVLHQGEKFSEDLGPTADYEWYIKIGLYGDIIYHPETVVGWRKYEGQVTTIKKQEYYGSCSQKIHLRMRGKVAQKLGSASDTFIAMASNYDYRVLAYHYARPWLANLITQPSVDFPRLIEVLFTMPREVLLDCFCRIRGKYFFYEESIATAQKFYRNYLETINASEIVTNYSDDREKNIF